MENNQEQVGTVNSTQPSESGDKENGRKKNTLVIIILVILGIFLLLFLFKDDPTVQKVINPIIKITPATATPSPTPLPTEEGIGQGDSTISGSVSLNGSIPAGATLAVSGQSVTNPGYSPIVGELAVEDGVTWEWNRAIEGNTYDVQAHLLDSSGSLIAQSPVVQVLAPETGVELIISIASELPAPPANSIRAECVEQDSAGFWQAKITYNINNPTSSALQYRVGIGTSSAGDLVFDSVVRPSSPDVTQTLTTDFILSTGTTYFTAYAYADCASCDDFSPASQWYQFSCSQPVSNTQSDTDPSSEPQVNPL